MRSSMTVPTANARRYMIQLCKHFAHRAPVRFDDREAHAEIKGGDLRMRASPDGLLALAEAQDPDTLALIERLVADHLKRFAFREPQLPVEWRRAPSA
jgi:hypothetical protein